MSKLKKIEKENKQARKAAKASKTAKNNNIVNDSDTESDESEGLSNYSTASEGEDEDKFEDAYSDSITNPACLSESNQIDGLPKGNEGKVGKRTKSCTSQAKTVPEKLCKKPQQSQRSLQKPKGSSSPRFVHHETAL